MATSLYPSRKDRRNRGVKKAPFYVLLGAQMPAVLVEVAYLSNRKDEQLLDAHTVITSVRVHGYGHPTAETLSALEERGICVLRRDLVDRSGQGDAQEQSQQT